ncbi:hypothetical protein CPC08DRAFT_184517 [Agrocybe pediades]|nr:hypothetical protein CPC08DRAFT_184517 [Agrocybe pediades]
MKRKHRVSVPMSIQTLLAPALRQATSVPHLTGQRVKCVQMISSLRWAARPSPIRGVLQVIDPALQVHTPRQVAAWINDRYQVPVTRCPLIRVPGCEWVRVWRQLRLTMDIA